MSEEGGPLMNIMKILSSFLRHAPLMMEEQKLSNFILGLGGQLATLANALIRAKAKLLSFQARDCKK